MQSYWTARVRESDQTEGRGECYVAWGHKGNWAHKDNHSDHKRSSLGSQVERTVVCSSVSSRITFMIRRLSGPLHTMFPSPPDLAWNRTLSWHVLGLLWPPERRLRIFLSPMYPRVVDGWSVLSQCPVLLPDKNYSVFMPFGYIVLHHSLPLPPSKILKTTSNSLKTSAAGLI